MKQILPIADMKHIIVAYMHVPMYTVLNCTEDYGRRLLPLCPMSISLYFLVT